MRATTLVGVVAFHGGSWQVADKMNNKLTRNEDWLEKRISVKADHNWSATTKRQQCLAYYLEELKLKVFQENEARLYNEAVMKYGMSAAPDSQVATAMLPAARRQAQSANEILRRRGGIVSVPDLVSPVYLAWQVAYSDYLSWATAQAATVLAVSNGVAPRAEGARRLLLRSEESRRKAEARAKRLLGKLKLRKDELRQMLIEASMAVASENWQPEEQPANDSELLRQRASQLEASQIQRRQASDESREHRHYLEELMERTAKVERANEQLQQELAGHKQAEELLRESEECYRQLVELAPYGLAVQTEGKVVFANSAAARLLEATVPEQLVGQPIIDFIAPGCRQMVQERVQEVIQGKRPAAIECELILPDKAEVNVEMVLTPVLYQGKPAVETVFHDMTQHKKGQKQLVNELELLRQRLIQLADSEPEDMRAQQELRVKASAIASSTSAIAIADREGNLSYVNPSFLRLWRYSDYRDVVGRPAVGFWQSEDKALEILETVEKDGWWVGELGAVGKDGSLSDVMVLASKIMDEAGEHVGFMASLIDITEQKKTQRQLIMADRLASFRELASGFAHELNNPLTGVIGFSELLLNNKDIPTFVRKDIETIHGEAQRAADVIRDFLTFAGGHPAAKQPINVNDMIRGVLKMREHQHQASNIRVNTLLAADLPGIMGVPYQLHQVFLYIIMNAEYFMLQARGGGTLTITTEKVGGSVRASFTDDGTGISEEDLAHVFDPFFTTKDVGQGTGLGLSVCHGIITEHRGTMSVQSRPGEGATFIVELPMVTGDRRREPGEPAADERSRATGAKILVVDDEPTILEFLSQVLTDEGHQVETINSASDALETVRSKRYRLILLDIEMPGISGIELYEHFRGIAESLAKRVVFITGDVLETDARDFLSRTEAPCIAKSFNAEQLEKEINRILA